MGADTCFLFIIALIMWTPFELERCKSKMPNVCDRAESLTLNNRNSRSNIFITRVCCTQNTEIANSSSISFPNQGPESVHKHLHLNRPTMLGLCYAQNYILFRCIQGLIQERFYSVEESQALVARLTRVRFTVGPHLLLHFFAIVIDDLYIGAFQCMTAEKP